MNWVRRGYVVGTLLLLIAAAAGMWWNQRNGSRPLYTTAAVERGNVQASVSATGNCNAVVTVNVGSQVSGNIKQLYADFNTKVKKGQLVALIDPELFQAQVDQARATLGASQAAAANARAMVVKSEADLATAQANLANTQAAILKTKAAVNDAQTKLATRNGLLKLDAVTKEDRDTAQTNYDESLADERAAEAQTDAASHAVQSAEAQRQVALAQLGSAQAQVKQAEAALRQAEVNFEHTRITAPVDGTVVARNMDIGQTVAASFQAPTIFQIAQDLTKMQVDTNVDEADVGGVRDGQSATFTVDAYPGRTFCGAVAQIREAPINVQNVVTYDVVISVDNSDLKLFPGMTATVRIFTSREENALKIPNAALRYRPAGVAVPKQPAGESIVWVIGPGGRPTAVAVKLGISDGSFTVVKDGSLNAGDRVIMSTSTKAAAAAAQPRMRGPGF